MRWYYGVLILVLCTFAVAQTVTVTVSVLEQNSQNVNYRLSLNNPSVTHDFGQPNLVQDLKVRQNFQCGGAQSLQLCFYFDQDQNNTFCSPLTFDNEITFQHNPRTAREVTFLFQGNVQFCSGSVSEIRQIEWTGGPGTSISQNLQAVDTSNAVSLGTVNSLVSSGGRTVVTSSSDPKLVAWFSEPGLLSATSRKSTNNPNDNLVVCVNSDENVDVQGNPVCDFVDSQVCVQKNSDWLLGDCCGDAPFQGCQFYSQKSAICGTNSGQRFTWAALGGVGKVIDLRGCPGVQVVSDGSKFFTCDEVPTGFSVIERFQGKTSISGREYLCDGSQIIECGADSPISDTAVSTGSRRVVQNDVYYCTSGGKWLKSLDAAGKESCSRAGLTWTGSRCCGEVSDSLQTYEDAFVQGSDGIAGGCFRGQFVPSGNSVPGTRSHINYRGVFHECRVGGASQLFNGTNIVPQLSRPCDRPLLDALSSGSKPHVVCTPQGEWVFTGDANEHYRKDTKWPLSDDDLREGCCPENSCWDGKACRERDEIVVRSGRGYRCE